MATSDQDDSAAPAPARPAVPQRRYRIAAEPRPVSPYAAPEPDPEPGRPSWRLWSVVRGVIVLALVGGLLGLLHVTGAARFPAAVNPWATGAATATGSDTAAAAPPGRLGAAPTGEGGYALLADDHGRPVAFDSCLPVHYVIRYDDAPPGAEQLVQGAAAQLSAATGLVLVYEGATDELPTADRAPRQPERYGDRWAPVLISWSGAGVHPEGTAPAVVDPDGRGPRIVTGQVVVGADTADPAVLSSRLLHQLGHLAGLDHVEDPADVMHAESAVSGGYSDGALRGLHVLGQGRCFG